MSYGKCQKCGANGIMRERRIDGNDKCQNGHTYPSRDAVLVGSNSGMEEWIKKLPGWIKISEVNPALALSDEKPILVYTPGYKNDPKMTFRVILVGLIKTCSEATHWKQCLAPESV